MRPFILQHVDALITTVGGLAACTYGCLTPRVATTSNLTQQRAKKILRICGPLVLVSGLIRFVTVQPSAPVWQRLQSSDGFASVEFPATPQSKRQTDTLNGISVERTSLTYDVPFKDISLFLSFSPLPAVDTNAPDTERFTALKAYFAQQGFSIVRESPIQLGSASGLALDLQRDGGKVRMWMRIAYVAGKVYRVVVSSTGSHHEDAIIGHYLESFRIERTGA